MYLFSIKMLLFGQFNILILLWIELALYYFLKVKVDLNISIDWIFQLEQYKKKILEIKIV